MNITLRQFRYFTAVAESGSVAAASRLLSIAQSAVTKAMLELAHDTETPAVLSNAVRYSPAGTVINVGLGVILAGAGWFARELWTAVQELKSDLSKLPLFYVARQDYRDDMREVKDLLSKIFDRLDNKQDKG